jgi:hypothetical protein
MLLSQPIEGARLSLRTLEADCNVASYLSWICDPDVTRYLESRFQEHSKETTRAYIEIQNSSYVSTRA